MRLGVIHVRTVAGASLLLLTALLSNLLVASASTASTAVSAASAADCREIPLVPFGIAPAPTGGAPDVDGTWCALVTTIGAGPYVINASVQVQTPDGRYVAPASIDGYGFAVFDLEGETTYRLTLRSDGLVAVHDGLGGGGCPVLADISWSAPRDEVGFAGGQLVCRQFTAAPQAVIRLNESVSPDGSDERIVIDRDGDVVCRSDGPWWSRCTLDEGPGPYRLIVGAAVNALADVSVVDTASTEGCTPIGTMAWGEALPIYERGAGGRRWECFAYRAGSTGGHAMRTMELDPRWAAQFELWQVGQGQVERNNTSNEASPDMSPIGLIAGEDYRFVLKGKPGAYNPAYRFGVFDPQGGSGCRRATGTDWNDAPMTGTVAGGSMDCYAFEADPGEKYRTQIEGVLTPQAVSGTVVNASCSNVRVCRIAPSGPYRLLVWQNGWQDVVTPRPYRAHLTEVDSPGCTPVPLASWDRALPIVATADDAPYHCYSLTPGAGRYHRLSTWEQSQYWDPAWELWEAGTVDQLAPFTDDTGLPSVDSDGQVFLEPKSSYRLVVSGDAADSAGEYRAGLFDVAHSSGCPVLADLSWKAPPVTGEVTKGELDCRQLPATIGKGDVVSVEDNPSQTRITDVNGFDCVYSLCEIDGQGPWRMTTGAGFKGDGGYRFFVTDPADLSGCPNATAALAFEAPPVSATLAPGTRACYRLDVDSSEVTGLFVEDGLATLVPPSGRGCSLPTRPTCSVTAGPQALVLENVGNVQRELTTLVRTSTSSPAACEALTSSPVTGTLTGLYDEQCFTFRPPAGSAFSVESAAAQGEVAPLVRIFGGATCTSYYPLECRGDGGQLVLSVVKQPGAAGRYAVSVESARAGFLVQPQVQGRPVVGSVLTVSGGITDPSDASVTVEWLRDGAVVATGRSYRLTPRDAGHRIQPRFTVRHEGYLDGVVTQPGVRVQEQRIAFSGRYSISGRPAVGRVLRAPVPPSRVSPAGTKVDYQWLRNGAAIRGATAASYRVTAADRGKALACRAVLKKAGYADLRIRTDKLRVR